MQEKWYRFVSAAGGEIPTTCPRSENSCGIFYIIYIMSQSVFREYKPTTESNNRVILKNKLKFTPTIRILLQVLTDLFYPKTLRIFSGLCGTQGCFYVS
jgi:hypothetical protein